MQIEVTGRKIDLTESIKEHAKTALNKINQHYSGISASLVFEKNRHLFHVHVEYREEHGQLFNAVAEDSDLYVAIDLACDKLRSQLNSNKAVHSNKFMN